MSDSNRAVFLDRDGTINVDKDYLFRIGDFEYLPGVIDALKRFGDAGYLLIIITNQSGIARGYYTESDYTALDSWLKHDLKQKGINISASYFCPHHPDADVLKYRKECKCRKPGTELFWSACREYNIDMDKSIAIGDRLRDLSICFESGAQGILLSDSEEAADDRIKVCSDWNSIVDTVFGNDKPLISVIVPIYNSASYLKECIDSILSQTYDNLEVILVDDGSSDGSSAICDEYKDADSRVVVLHKQNEGLIRARKSGFEVSHGEYIAFVDSDDRIGPDMIRDLQEMARTHSADVVLSAADFYTGASYVIRKNVIKPGVYKGDELEEIKGSLFGAEDYFAVPIMPYVWNKLWKRSILEEELYHVDPEITVGEDVAIGFPAIARAGCIAVTDRSFYRYRQIRGSMVNQTGNDPRERVNAGRLYKYLCRRFSGIGYYLPSVEKGLKRFYIHQLFTRAYSEVCREMKSEGCFPFLDRVKKPVVIYGAGSFGTAVYDYAKSRFGVRMWIDANAAFLRTMDYPVVTLEDAVFEPDDIVIVPVFVKRTALDIRKALLDSGIPDDNIYLFGLSDEQEMALLGLLIDE